MTNHKSTYEELEIQIAELKKLNEEINAQNHEFQLIKP
jgi:hypothetical protein